MILTLCLFFFFRKILVPFTSFFLKLFFVFLITFIYYLYIYIYVVLYGVIWYYMVLYIYMVFTTEGLFEVAIESWPEWDLNPRPLNSVSIYQKNISYISAFLIFFIRISFIRIFVIRIRRNFSVINNILRKLFVFNNIFTFF